MSELLESEVPGDGLDLHGREGILEYLRLQIEGPRRGAEEVLRDPPTREYLVGVVYPQNADASSTVQQEANDSGAGSIGEETPDDPITLANQRMPASVGLSFFVRGTDRLEVDMWGAIYEESKASEAADVSSGSRRKGWVRSILAAPHDPQTETVFRSEPPEKSVLAGRATLHVKWRDVGDSHLVTVTLLNARKLAKEGPASVEDCLFQVGFRCRAVNGIIGEYPRAPQLREDPEVQELELLYDGVRAYAVGHGCAAEWTEVRVGQASDVQTAFIPAFELPPIVPRELDLAVMDASRLAAGGAERAVVIDELREFVAGYDQWRLEKTEQAQELSGALRAAALRVVEKMATASSRMAAGVDLLARDEDAWLAFRLANLAIVMQFRHSQENLGGAQHRRDTVVMPSDDFAPDTKFRWRPFQLAFQLLVLPSLTNADDDWRETVDLLWFPTGGGKTEAYLALAAYEAFLRRLRDPQRGAGTAIITRYTLRLLTAQQFQRAAALLCACELIRRVREDELGSQRMTIGLWIGSEAVPNSFVKAHEFFEEMRNQDKPENRFQLERCPWCGTEIVPRELDEEGDGCGIRSTDTSFAFFCPTHDCAFHDSLPIHVIDQALYAEPPTMLVATVDKLARLAWEPDAGVLFGSSQHDPPSLVIQDELHLLSGPLGTVAGVYEAAIETMLAIRGKPAKILSSTATIRNSSEQVGGLFGTEVALFPPSGLEYSDSYFATLDTESSGRMYAGVMAPSHTMQTTIVHVAAVLLQATQDVSLDEDELDAFWTLVMYHNSLRELGGAVTMAHDDIPARIKVISPAEDARRTIDDDEIVELTSNVPGRKLPGILDRLAGKDPDASPISMLLATNMLSVGVDIQRLALMLVNGQPKLTSEYIQATSRVGRSAVPGLIVSCYSAGKPRDRSHYENFRQYHAALYRHVEPSSVTPSSLPARGRALHAGLVILVRHGLGLSANAEASDFSRVAGDLGPYLDAIVRRMTFTDAGEALAIRGELDELVDAWLDEADDAAREGKKLYYSTNSTKNHHSLLCNFGSSGRGWQTLHSMRNVDRQCNIAVKGEETSS